MAEGRPGEKKSAPQCVIPRKVCYTIDPTGRCGLSLERSQMATKKPAKNAKPFMPFMPFGKPAAKKVAAKKAPAAKKAACGGSMKSK